MLPVLTTTTLINERGIYLFFNVHRHTHALPFVFLGPNRILIHGYHFVQCPPYSERCLLNCSKRTKPYWVRVLFFSFLHALVKINHDSYIYVYIYISRCTVLPVLWKVLAYIMVHVYHVVLCFPYFESVCICLRYCSKHTWHYGVRILFFFSFTSARSNTSLWNALILINMWFIYITLYCASLPVCWKVFAYRLGTLLTLMRKNLSLCTSTQSVTSLWNAFIKKMSCRGSKLSHSCLVESIDIMLLFSVFIHLDTVHYFPLEYLGPNNWNMDMSELFLTPAMLRKWDVCLMKSTYTCGTICFKCTSTRSMTSMRNPLVLIHRKQTPFVLFHSCYILKTFKCVLDGIHRYDVTNFCFYAHRHCPSLPFDMLWS